MLCGFFCAFILVELEARHHMVHDGIGVEEAQFVNRSSSFYEFKVSFTEVMFENFPCFVR